MIGVVSGKLWNRELVESWSMRKMAKGNLSREQKAKMELQETACTNTDQNGHRQIMAIHRNV